MIAVVQRVSSARVSAGGKNVGIGKGLVALVGISDADTSSDAIKLGKKLSKLRIMSDSEGKLNLDLSAAGAQLLIISQFTLIADIGSGNRPSFAHAAKNDRAKLLFDELVATAQSQLPAVKVGFFGLYMKVELENDGPVTLVLDTQKI